MDEIENLAKKLGEIVEKGLPEEYKFVLLIARKDKGKCATNIKQPLLSTYLKKCANTLPIVSVNGMEIIEIYSEDLLFKNQNNEKN